MMHERAKEKNNP
jgi:hypothetical protein